MKFKDVTITEVPYIDTRMGFFYDFKDQDQLVDGEPMGTLWVRDHKTDQVNMYPVSESDYKLFINGFNVDFCFRYLNPADQEFINSNFEYYLQNHENDVVIVPVIRKGKEVVLERKKFHYGKVLERQTM